MNHDEYSELNELNLSEQERAQMERLLGEFRQEATERAERPELFWAAQRSRIASRIRASHTQRGLGWAATVAAATAMVVFMTVPSHTPTKPGPKTAVVTAARSQASDEELLRSVDETMNSDVPDALAPANLLAKEMDRGLNGSSSNTNSKTGRNNE